MREPLDPDEVYAGDLTINTSIHDILTRFPEPSRSRMRTKIRQDRDALRRLRTDQADAAARHTFREFIVGDQLCRQGIRLEYNRKIGHMTPDWFSSDRRLVLEVFTVEREGMTDPGKRAMDNVQGKVRKYAGICREHGLSLVVVVHGDFLSLFSENACERAIAESNLFEACPMLGGVIYFGESTAIGRVQQYSFTYFPNARAGQYPELPLPQRITKQSDVAW